MDNYIIYNTINLEVKGQTDNPLDLLGTHLGVVASDIPAHKAKLVRDEEGNITVVPKKLHKTQQERYFFLKNLMLNIAEELSKSPSEAFAIKSDIEELKFWAELGAAEAVIAKLQALEESTVFTSATKEYLIATIENFLENENTLS